MFRKVPSLPDKTLLSASKKERRKLSFAFKNLKLYEFLYFGCYNEKKTNITTLHNTQKRTVGVSSVCMEI